MTFVGDFAAADGPEGVEEATVWAIAYCDTLRGMFEDEDEDVTRGIQRAHGASKMRSIRCVILTVFERRCRTEVWENASS